LESLSSHFEFFAQLGDLFEARFLKPLWERYASRESDDWQAVGIFVAGYAFERQGAMPDYRHVAVDVAQELAQRGQLLTDENTVQLSWDLFRGRLSEEKLNYANNPFCPKGTCYERKTGSVVTYNKSVIEFLCDISRSGFQPNIVVFAKAGLTTDHAKDMHNAIQEMNGIGPKIASLFLRDVAVFYNIFPSRDRHLLQPVDIWVQRTFEQLALHEGKKTQDTEKIQRWIVENAARAGVEAEAVNEGMWYFSSQVADSDYRMSKALNNLKYARVLVAEHVEAMRQEVTAWEKLAEREKSGGYG
jgi:Holliday junction resolvasome RuvABC DNA-binding subunit